MQALADRVGVAETAAGLAERSEVRGVREADRVFLAGCRELFGGEVACGLGIV